MSVCRRREDAPKKMLEKFNYALHFTEVGDLSSREYTSKNAEKCLAKTSGKLQHKVNQKFIHWLIRQK